MRSLDEDYFFIKNIRIGNPMSRMIQTQPKFEFLTDQKIGADIRFSRIRPLANIIPELVKISVNDGKPMNMKCENGRSSFSFNLPNTEKQRVMLLDAQYEKKPFRQYTRIPLPDDDFDVSFYPEGGAALAGCTGRTAIKAMQRDGTEINVSGVVYNRQGDEVTNFKTDVRGTGLFTMKPERDDSYYAVCTNDKGQSKRFELPVAKEDGYALTASWFRDRLTVRALTPGPSPQERGADTLCLIVHTRGVVQDVRIWENTSVPLVFPKEFFPPGVSHLLLLSKEMIPVSERLIFVNNDDQAKVECRTDKDTYSARSQVEYAVNITDESGEPLLGNFSVAVTDDHDVTADTTFNILISLLLTSDLRGNIPDPAYFFRKKDQSSVYALDLLMLTQGWRRYDTERIVRNDLIQPDTLLANGYDLSGTVKYSLTKKPAENAGVSVLSFGGGFSEEANTDRNGIFYLHVGEIYDSTRLVVQTSPQLGRQNLELSLDKPTYPERTIPVVAAGAPDREQFAQYADKAEQQYVDEHGTRVIPISEVTITAQKKKTVDYSFFYKASDAAYNITEEELDKFPATSMSSLLMRLPGINVFDGKITAGVCRTVIVVDDIKESDLFYILELLNVSDIAQIDFFTDPHIALIFEPFSFTDICIRIISIHTKRGKPNAPRETLHIKPAMPLGFQRPAEFYAPKYDTPAKNTKPDLRTTIHWQPNITTDEDGKASFSFYTADTPSTYSVVIEGMTADGKIVYKRDKIVIHPR